MTEPAGGGPGPVVPGHRRRRRLLLVGASLLVLLAVPAAVVLFAVIHLDTNLTRLDGVFEGLADRPRVSAGAQGAVNILVLGTDRAAEAALAPASNDLGLEAARSDTLMLLHLDADRRTAAVISIPRDTRVEVPGHGTDRIATAITQGGPRLGVATVEHLTGVRVDHVAVVDWSRFGALVDAVGGIDVDVAETVHDPVSGLTWQAGRTSLDGPAAVRFVRQTAGLPHGELDRIARQHAVLAAVMADALHQEMRKNPRLLYRFLDTLTDHLAIDADWSLPQMGSLVVSMRDFRSAQISYLTMPVVAVGQDGVLHPDKVSNRALWDAVAHDRVSEWEAQHADALTPPVVR